LISKGSTTSFDVVSSAGQPISIKVQLSATDIDGLLKGRGPDIFEQSWNVALEKHFAALGYRSREIDPADAWIYECRPSKSLAALRPQILEPSEGETVGGKVKVRWSAQPTDELVANVHTGSGTAIPTTKTPSGFEFDSRGLGTGESVEIELKNSATGAINRRHVKVTTVQKPVLQSVIVSSDNLKSDGGEIKAVLEVQTNEKATPSLQVASTDGSVIEIPMKLAKTSGLQKEFVGYAFVGRNNNREAAVHKVAVIFRSQLGNFKLDGTAVRQAPGTGAGMRTESYGGHSR
jgi:hypothetical protein